MILQVIVCICGSKKCDDCKQDACSINRANVVKVTYIEWPEQISWTLVSFFSETVLTSCISRVCNETIINSRAPVNCS